VILMRSAWLLALLLAAGCAGDGARPGVDDLAEAHATAAPRPAAPTLDDRLVGDWETDPTLSQLGVTVVRYTFRADGTFASETELRSMKLPEPLRAKGTYRIDGDQIRFASTTNVGKGTSSTRSTYRFDGVHLVLVERDGDEFVLKRR
jgi:hypothetical protein